MWEEMNSQCIIHSKVVLARWMLLALLLLTATLSDAGVSADPNHYEIAFHWAPVHIQNADWVLVDSQKARQDFIARFDYDGNWKGPDNWDHFSAHATTLEAVAYYAMTESTTHFFIYYAFFHPHDWGSFTITHENDMEGMLLFVRKDDTPLGRLEGAITTAHGHLLPYQNPAVTYMSPSVWAARPIRFMQLATGFIGGETHTRPWTYQEDEGHGLYHCGEPGGEVLEAHVGGIIKVTTPNLTNCHSLRNSKIIYIPTRSFADFSTLPPSGGTVTVKYRLLDTTAPSGLFARRFDHPTFADYSKPFPRIFAGDCALLDFTCREDAATAPWSWDDKDDGALSTAWGTDPASLLLTYWIFSPYWLFSHGHFLEQPSSTYIRNDFAAGGNVCTVTGVPFSMGEEAPDCVQRVCSFDAFCCETSWDSQCVANATAICGHSCDNCVHSPYVTGAALIPSCSQCAAEVCNLDPFCCSIGWDAPCTNHAAVCQFRYEVHQEDNGWLGPCREGEACSETGKSRRLEAVRIYDPASGGHMCYRVHLQGMGWQPEVCSGRLAGTQDQDRRLEAITIRLVNAPVDHRVCYQAHVQDKDWQPEVCNGIVAGTTGQSKRMESLKIRIIR